MTQGAAFPVLEALRARHVAVSRRGDHLCLRGPKGAVDPALLGEVREHKSELLTWVGTVERVLALPLSQFERSEYAIEVRVPWWEETLWFVPRATDVDPFIREGVARGRIWTALELRYIADLGAPTSADIPKIGRLKIAFGADVVAVMNDIDGTKEPGRA